MQSVGLAGVSAALGGCEAGSDALAKLLTPEDGADFRPPASAQIDLTAHILNRLTYGPTPGDYRRVTALGVDRFIDEQLDPDAINDRRCDWKAAQIESLSEPTPELYDYTPQELLDDLTRARILRGVYSKRQLYELMVEFWTDHFNIVSSKGDCKWLKAADDREVIRKYTLGSFRDMVRASALSPAMLIYLDGHDNKVVQAGDRPNENYARELMELHTLGVHGGYTQKDVMEVARCLSGWTIDRSLFKLDGRFFRFDRTEAQFNPARHDDGQKIVLGRTIPAGEGPRDLERVLDLVCDHPSTARHIAVKLCRRFIADPPPDAAVGVVAQAFADSKGDIKRTLRALFASDEFRGDHAPETDKPMRGNLFKRPMHFVISALRATNASSDGGPPIMDSLQRMGHAPFQYPTPDGYPLEAQPWLGTLLWRWNFALALQAGQLAGTSVSVAGLEKTVGGKNAMAAHLLGRTPTDLELQVINDSNASLALMLASPAFQRF